MSGRPGQYPPPVKKQTNGQPPPTASQYPGQQPPAINPGYYPQAPSAPGQYPPPGAPGQYPPSVPGQYPPHGAPRQYPPPTAPGQYPPPSAPGQYPPPSAPRQYPPPAAAGQYPPHGAPGQYPPSGAPGQYPPPGAPGQYPPPGAPGQYPPHGVTYPAPGAPGQYPPPGAPGQYPPPGAPRHYPPPGAPGQYPPPGAPGQYPPPGGTYPAPGAPGQYPPPGTPQYPPHGQFPPSLGIQGQDTVDSDGENYIYTRHSDHPVEVKFVNKTNDKVMLSWINEKGNSKKITKLKRGQFEDVDTFESHPFFADTKHESDAVINGNFVFFAEHALGGHNSVRAEITYGPKRNTIRSTASGAPVMVKFSNRTHKTVSIKWIDVNGYPKMIKNIGPKKAWLFNSCEGHYFIACENGREREEMDLNFGWFYLVKRGNNPQSVRKVIITEQADSSSSSSSDSD